MIEMMVVLIIIAVLAALTAPALGRFYQNIALDSATQQLRTFLDTARIRAALDHTSCRIVILPDWRRLQLEIKRQPQLADPAAVVKMLTDTAQPSMLPFTPAEGAFARMELPSGVSLKYFSLAGIRRPVGRRSEIVFGPFGPPEKALFVLTNGAHHHAALQLEAGTGIVRDLPVVDEDLQNAPQ